MAAMIIHVDIDMTIVDIAHYFEAAKGVRPIVLTYDWDTRYYPGAIADIVQWLDDGREERVIDGAFEAIDAMISAGNVVWIATARTEKAMAMFRVKYPGYARLVRSKRDVVAKKERCDVLIDDYPMAEHVALAGRVYIVERDYNASIMPGFPRVASVRDVLRAIL
jgi:hypothetical protein